MNKASRGKRKKRLQFDFTKNQIANLDDLKQRTEAASSAEVVRRALQLYRIVVQHPGQVILRGNNGQDVLVLIPESSANKLSRVVPS